MPPGGAATRKRGIQAWVNAMNHSPDDVAPVWPYQVLIPIAGQYFLSRLEAMDLWLSEWDIPYQVASPASGDSAIAIRFPKERFARAFVAQQFRDAVPARRSKACSPTSSWTRSTSTARGFA